MKVLLAMSGGIDSSLACKFLLDQGYEVEGAYMILHGRKDYHEENIKNVEKVAEFFGIKYHVFDLQNDFKSLVYDDFINSYKLGLTPNPCAVCNKFIKFGKFYEFAKSKGFEKIATGHYARIENNLIKSAADELKDQSYFLGGIEKSIIPHIIFPLGDKIKSDLKSYAAQIKPIANLATQKESTEICFVENTYLEVLNKHFDTHQKGQVINTDGEVVGSHDGYMNFTIGKRKGFTYDGAHEPHYVLSINPKENQIIVGLKDELKNFEFKTKNLNNFTNLNEFNCLVKVRYRSKGLPCEARINSNGGLDVKLKEPAFGIASGQLAVFYDEEKRVLASGFIV